MVGGPVSGHLSWSAQDEFQVSPLWVSILHSCLNHRNKLNHSLPEKLNKFHLFCFNQVNRLSIPFISVVKPDFTSEHSDPTALHPDSRLVSREPQMERERKRERLQLDSLFPKNFFKKECCLISVLEKYSGLNKY